MKHCHRLFSRGNSSIRGQIQFMHLRHAVQHWFCSQQERSGLPMYVGVAVKSFVYKCSCWWSRARSPTDAPTKQNKLHRPTILEFLVVPPLSTVGRSFPGCDDRRQRVQARPIDCPPILLAIDIDQLRFPHHLNYIKNNLPRGACRSTRPAPRMSCMTAHPTAYSRTVAGSTLHCQR